VFARVAGHLDGLACGGAHAGDLVGSHG
jgi:hypothetical protein